MNTDHLPLDLSREAVHALWQRNGVLGAVMSMEHADTWSVDGMQRAEDILAEFCHRVSLLDKSGVESAMAPGLGNLIGVSGHLATGRGLAMFRWISDISPALSSAMVAYASENPGEFNAVMLDRMITLERARILSRVFAPERTALIMEILDEMSGGQGEPA